MLCRGTYNSAMAAKGIYEEENDNVKVHVFDSLSTGPEMRLLIEKLKETSKKIYHLRKLQKKDRTT